uniref:C-type lectin domain-containing protein n=1 Tax=Terrapene triunguis TaxID=2587831 RepID=A0A674JE71_9SAUR
RESGLPSNAWLSLLLSLIPSNWNQGEPNNFGSGEDCVMMFKDGKWNDATCVMNEVGWICEKNPCSNY